MPEARLEHVNLTVTDIERSTRLVESLCGWRVRWRGPSRLGGETIHVGSDTAYLAFHTDGADHTGKGDGPPLNHVGLLVDDLDRAEETVFAHGLLPFNHADYDPGRRFYFLDWDGIEFEVISYAPQRQKASS